MFDRDHETTAFEAEAAAGCLDETEGTIPRAPSIARGGRFSARSMTRAEDAEVGERLAKAEVQRGAQQRSGEQASKGTIDHLAQAHAARVLQRIAASRRRW